jgi:hypothetical protein
MHSSTPSERFAVRNDAAAQPYRKQYTRIKQMS